MFVDYAIVPSGSTDMQEVLAIHSEWNVDAQEKTL